jgi:hypothetical protein
MVRLHLKDSRIRWPSVIDAFVGKKYQRRKI